MVPEVAPSSAFAAAFTASSMRERVRVSATVSFLQAWMADDDEAEDPGAMSVDDVDDPADADEEEAWLEISAAVRMTVRERSLAILHLGSSGRTDDA